MKKNLYKFNNFEPTDYANIKTGEILGPGVEIKEIVVTDESIYKSKHCLILDTDALNIVKSNLSYSDFGALIRMCENVSWDFNVLLTSDKTIPHTNSSIAKELNITGEGARKILNKLVSKNILAYCICYPAGFKKKVYILNPSLMRRGNKFKNAVSSMFRDLTEPFDEVNEKIK
jgi:hypothetical protein